MKLKPAFRRPKMVIVFICSYGMLGTCFLSAQTTPPQLAHGKVGLGTYATVAQFQDLNVTLGDQVLLNKSLSTGLADFDLSGGGQWKVVDFVLQQSSTDARGMNIFTGDQGWTDYAVSVKARKLSGKEGFSLGFRAESPENFACLNVGGWNNTKTQFGITINGTFSTIGESTNFKVETNRWYNVKVEVKGDEATGYVDGQRVAWAQLIAPATQPSRSSSVSRQGNVNRGAANTVTTPPVANPPTDLPTRTVGTVEQGYVSGKTLWGVAVASISIVLVACAMLMRGRTAVKPRPTPTARRG